MMLGIVLYIYGLLTINDVLPWFTYVLFFAQPGESGILKAPSHGFKPNQRYHRYPQVGAFRQVIGLSPVL